jgi:phosphohistidine phosphatase
MGPDQGRCPLPEHTLIVLRHAKSDWSGGEEDRLRPLAKRGRRQAPEAGEWLAANVGRIDLAVISPSQRTRSTWELVSAELDVPPPTRFDERVYGASEGTLLEVLRELPEDLSTVVLVGHNPGIEGLVSTLTGHGVRMVTSALAVLHMPGPWSSAGDSSAELEASGRPPTDTRHSSAD